MKIYPKMQTLYKRDAKTHKIMLGVLSKPEFSNIRKWEFTEKIDGSNTRIEYDNSDPCNGSLLSFTGRTGKPILSKKMLSCLEENFKLDVLTEVFPEAHNVTLFGEGYGGGIQKGGGLYREDNGFILFDVYIDGWWLERESVDHIAYRLGIKSVPVLPFDSVEEAIAYVISKPQSGITSHVKTAEGVVARSDPLMLFRNENLMAWKLKVQDYIDLGVIEG